MGAKKESKLQDRLEDTEDELEMALQECDDLYRILRDLIHSRAKIKFLANAALGALSEHQQSDNT